MDSGAGGAAGWAGEVAIRCEFTASADYTKPLPGRLGVSQVLEPIHQVSLKAQNVLAFADSTMPVVPVLTGAEV